MRERTCGVVRARLGRGAGDFGEGGAAYPFAADVETRGWGGKSDTFPHARSSIEQPGFTVVEMSIALTQLFMFFCCRVSRLLSSFLFLSCLEL